MEIKFLQVADYANITNDQKLNVMGIFSNIAAAKFPVQHAEMYLVAQLSAGPAEYGRKFKLGIKLLDEDGNEVLGFEADMLVPTGQNGTPVYINLTFRLVNTPFNVPGTYAFSLLVDGDEKGSLRLEVVKTAPSSL